MPPRPGGAIGDLSNDDYVAQVLASEARDNSVKYTSEGLGAYMPKGPSGAAPKPNTRFLRNIIRDTDSHNTALKRKEEREARERMRRLREKAAGSSSTSHDTRRHRHHPSNERDAGRERRDDRERRHRSHRRRHRSDSASPERSRRHRRRYDDEHDRHGYSRRDRRRDRDDDERDNSRRHRSYSGSRSRSPREERSSRRRHHRYSRSPSRSRSRSPGLSGSRRYKEDGKSRDSHRSSREHRSSHRHQLKQPSPPPTTIPTQQSPSDDSDPLEDLVGPLPKKGDGNDDAAPIRSRGRGAYKPNTSTIDAHFAKDYDPTLDVHLDDDDLHSGSRSSRRPVPGLMTEDDDWELALEALRDRARWKQKGEERLRQAGFNEDTVERWKSNTAFTGGGAGAGDTEGQIEDVKWSKRGEGREWDRGKVFDEDGHVDVKASW